MLHENSFLFMKTALRVTFDLESCWSILRTNGWITIVDTLTAARSRSGYPAWWSSWLEAEDEGRVEEVAARRSEEGRTVASLWAELLTAAAEEEEQVDGRSEAPSPRCGGSAPSAAPHAATSAGAVGSYRNSRAWPRGPRPTRSRRNRPRRWRCPVTSPWRRRDGCQMFPEAGSESFSCLWGPFFDQTCGLKRWSRVLTLKTGNENVLGIWEKVDWKILRNVAIATTGSKKISS